ncbi:TetR/AcrR family transcriptional regulator [Poseidonocella sedimentorum]|uniref:DNA-binding transcriptional regulator, AcrR family n=1 Tax=Poseidonocella sedimentorum TaxID=871652 RepID=A0A1I6D2U1_9RHOB|nr:TetR/AcrR family transcriptional regulator [Poseidonocella sedimentorum]SFQ99818.1 DNA-binding transcriptional regulator, AcrR family [Poseidonocella sedimentorum]
MTETMAPVRKGRKYDQVVAGALKVFMTDGFEGASVDDIARTAGVSKATLYSYFPDKRLLFLEVATTECARQAERAVHDIDMSNAPDVVLGQAGVHLLEFVTSRIGTQVFRICAAERERFPELGQTFYNSGPAIVEAALCDYFRLAIERGELRIDDLELAAQQFCELCKAGIFLKLLFGLGDRPDETQLHHAATEATKTFLARYGT